MGASGSLVTRQQVTMCSLCLIISFLHPTHGNYLLKSLANRDFLLDGGAINMGTLFLC